MLACLIAIVVGLIFLRMTKGMTFMASDTDAEKQVRAAAQLPQWVWPSGMHRYARGKALMKDAPVLGLVLLQRLLGDVRSVFPVTALCTLAHLVSAVLIFFVAKGYWGNTVGWLLFILSITSFWPYQVILMEGFQGVAQMFLLASIFCLQQSQASPLFSSLWSCLAGVGVGFMIFSSASARKFLPLAVGAFLFTHRGEMAHWDGMRGATAWLFFLGSLFLLFHLERKAVPNEQQDISQRIRKSSKELGLLILLLVLLPLLLARSVSFLLAEFLVAVGIFLVVLFFTLPHVIANVKGYLSYWDSQQLYGHFRLYRDYFARKGRPILEGIRGAGLLWVLRFFWLFVPFHCLLCGFALAFFLGKIAANGFLLKEILSFLGLFILSFSPILVGELTGSAQVARSYFPAFLGILLFIGEASFQWQQLLAPQARWIFWSGGSLFLLICAGWNLWVFLSDVWPSRMAPAWVAQRLLKLQPGPFYTYETPYNNCLVGAFPEALRLRLTIHPIRTLAEVREGYVVVPGTSSKSFTMESEAYAIQHGDFREDPALSELLDLRRIERFAVGSFKTLGSSRFWVQESDVASYRELILKEITDEDRFRGRAWILDAGKLVAGRVRRQAGVWIQEVALGKGAGAPCGAPLISSRFIKR